MSENKTGKMPKKTASTKMISGDTQTTSATGKPTATKTPKLTGEQEDPSRTGSGAPGAKTRASKPKSPASIEASGASSATRVRQVPSHQEIAMLAYFLFEKRGSQHGFHHQDWIRAEQELLRVS
jgi:hypothetical protein